MTPSAERQSRSPAPVTRAPDRQLARSVQGVFALASALALIGPLLSYRSDLAQLDDLFRTRVTRESGQDANALRRHLRLLTAELERLADRPEVDLLDASMRPEQELLDSAHRNSTLFDTGVAIVDARGELIWREPADLTAGSIVAGDWFARLASSGRPTYDISDPAKQTFLVAVPVLRQGRLTGALVGLSRPMLSALSPASAGDPVVRILLDASGRLIPPEQPPAWAEASDFLQRLRQLPDEEGQLHLNSGEELFSSRAKVGDTGVTIIEVGNEEQISQPVRYRFRLQLALLTSLNTGGVILLALLLQAINARFVMVERREQEEDRLRDLGKASSLIAHEVKNSLNGLQAAASLLSSSALAGQPDIALPVGSIRGEVDRLKHLASSLLLFGRPADVRLQQTGLPQLVREVVDGMQVIPEMAEVSLTLDVPEELNISCDPLLLATAVHNIVRNAVEAVISAKDLGRAQSPHVLVRVLHRDNAVAIEVEDNAGGLVPEVAGRLFEPFVTGKPKGIGLGLSMTRRAMEAQRGAVLYEAIPDGSRFVLELPAAAHLKHPAPALAFSPGATT